MPWCMAVYHSHAGTELAHAAGHVLGASWLRAPSLIPVLVAGCSPQSCPVVREAETLGVTAAQAPRPSDRRAVVPRRARSFWPGAGRETGLLLCTAQA